MILNHYMRVLSIDVGIKNLAFCLFEKKEEFSICKWDVVNLAEQENITCGICNKPAKYIKNDTCFCLKHAKKQNYLIPTTECKKTFINKQKIQKMVEIADKYEIKYEKGIKRADLILAINEYINNNCFNEIGITNASKVDLIQIGMNLKLKFDKLFLGDTTIDHVIIENQISPIANRMKTIQGMIVQYFIMVDIDVGNIEFISASNKLKDWSDPNKKALSGAKSEETLEVLAEGVCDVKDKTKYSDRKKMGIAKCLEIITNNPHFNEHIDYFKTHKKKDDLSDSFLQGMWFINDKKL